MKMAHRAASAEIFSTALADFFSNSNVGLAVFDEKLRYQAINPWLANVHRYSVDFHIGKTAHAILGEVASAAEPAIRRVFATGRPASNVEVGGRLPTKKVAERWLDNFFPIKNHRGEVHQVGAVVLPIAPGIVETNEIAPDTVLRSWKEIGSYVGACAKTVQRWEQKYKFPVRRVQASKGAVVFAIRAEVNDWLSQCTRTALGGECSWSNFINSPLPTLILDDERTILDANVSISSLIGTTTDNLIGKKLEAFRCGPNTMVIEREWLVFRQTGGLVGLHSFCRVDGTVFSAEYTLRTMQPGVRILTVTSVLEEPVSEKAFFHQAGPKRLPL
jgi:PAS domain-containing protein